MRANSKRKTLPTRLEARRLIRSHKKPAALVILLMLLLAGAFLFARKDANGDQVAEVSRRLLGDEKTVRIESWYFSGQDKIDRLHFRIFGGSSNPFGSDQS